MPPFAYLFRFCCDPSYNSEREIGQLRSFVEEARVDDVMVFCNVQEINTGHTTHEERELYLALLRKVKGVLPEGVTLSVNQWHSVMHQDAGKRLRDGQGFRLMVDVDGREAALSVCPACAAWRGYIADLYAAYAAVEPFILWVEDDFRFHNHDPLHWGGCFCDWHMREYSRAAGRELDREAFLAGVLQPGEAHPYRKIWLDCCKDVLVSAAEAIGEAARGVSAASRVGLMSSLPQVHAAEGRDWNALLRALSGANPPVCRVHLPAYSEAVPSRYMIQFNLVSLLNRAFLPPETEVYPELENFPYSLFAKSRRFTRFQLVSMLPLAPSGATIDLYDLNGNGIVREEGYQDTLREIKPRLARLVGSGAFSWEKIGVRVPVSPRSSYTLRTEKGEALDELYPHDAFFGGLFGAYGVAFRYETGGMPENEVVAVGGQYFRNLAPEEIKRVFQNNFVILNGDAAATLADMGCGELAGISGCEWVAQNNGDIAYEQVEDGETYCGMDGARASAMVLCSDVLRVTYAGVKAETLTGFYNAFRERTADGLTVVDDRALVFPFGRFASPTDIPPMLLNNIRQALFRRVLSGIPGRFAAVPMVVGQPYLFAYAYRNPAGGEALYVVNAAADDAEGFCIRAGSRSVYVRHVVPAGETVLALWGAESEVVDFVG